MEYVVLVVMLALIQYIWFSIEVGRARGRFGVLAPATTGHVLFDRYYRAHQNTAEQLIVFLPSVLTSGYYVDATFAAVLGLIFVVGRGLYFRGYTDPEKSRGLGFAISMVANSVMILATVYAVGLCAIE
jgi:uncharacterized membrane protein YecN with MAPEG domain